MNPCRGRPSTYTTSQPLRLQPFTPTHESCGSLSLQAIGKFVYEGVDVNMPPTLAGTEVEKTLSALYHEVFKQTGLHKISASPYNADHTWAVAKMQRQVRLVHTPLSTVHTSVHSVAQMQRQVRPVRSGWNIRLAFFRPQERSVEGARYRSSVLYGSTAAAPLAESRRGCAVL